MRDEEIDSLLFMAQRWACDVHDGDEFDESMAPVCDREPEVRNTASERLTARGLRHVRSGHTRIRVIKA